MKKGLLNLHPSEQGFNQPTYKAFGFHDKIAKNRQITSPTKPFGSIKIWVLKWVALEHILMKLHFKSFFIIRCIVNYAWIAHWPFHRFTDLGRLSSFISYKLIIYYFRWSLIDVIEAHVIWTIIIEAKRSKLRHRRFC